MKVPLLRAQLLAAGDALVNQVLVNGRLSRKLPYIKKNAVELLKSDFDTTEAAVAALVGVAPWQILDDGLDGKPINQHGDLFFFGLLFETQTGSKDVIDFLWPNRQEDIEYEISRRIYELLWPASPRLHYRLEADAIEILFTPTDFTQVNPHINRQMVARVIDLLQLSPTDRVLDLFCGLGNFTLPVEGVGTPAVGDEFLDGVGGRIFHSGGLGLFACRGTTLIGTLCGINKAISNKKLLKKEQYRNPRKRRKNR